MHKKSKKKARAIPHGLLILLAFYGSYRLWFGSTSTSSAYQLTNLSLQDDFSWLCQGMSIKGVLQSGLH